MKLRKIAASIGFAAAFGLATTSANAALQFFYPQTDFEDDNIDFHIDVNGNGIIDVGDRLVSVFEIIRTSDPFGGGESLFAQTEELTGIIDTIVATAVPLAPGFFEYTFAPNPTGYLAGTPGAIASAWYQPAGADLNLILQNCNSLATCVAAATNGNLLFEVGFAGDPDEYFALRGSNDPAVVLAGPSGNSFTTGSYAFSILTNNTGLQFGPMPCFPNAFPGQCTAGDGATQLVGSGSILGGQGLNQGLRDNGAFGRSDFDFSVRPIPEPASLALLGLGLFGLAFARRRKQ